MITFKGIDKRIKEIEEIKALKRPVFVWGGYTYGGVIEDYLRENGIQDKITYVVDDEYLKPEDHFLPLSEYLTSYADHSAMVFGFYNYKIICKKRETYGDRIKHLYDFHLTALNDRRLKWDRREAESRLPEFNKTYEMLNDEKSRRTMELYLRAAVNGEFDKLYKECHEDFAYFNNVTESLKIETLVDCGAFDGDSIHDFVSVFEDYNRIYAIEPDSRNLEKLCDRIEREKIRNVIVVPKGVYRESTTLYFSSDGNSASHMDERGDAAISAIRLDQLLGDCHGRTFIKMDIEGSEMDALVGVSQTISRIHPCLAICVYHKETDLIEIPQYIESIAGQGVYEYYLRFHGLDLAELVFYAVPREWLDKGPAEKK